MSHAARLALSPLPGRLSENAAGGRFGPLLLACGLYFAISTLTRAVLAALSALHGQVPARMLPEVAAIGAMYDTVTCLYLFAPLALYLALMPDRWYRSQLHRPLFYGAFAASLFGLIYLGAVEYFFFDEFNARFDFVAVEYLIYPHEVFVNIWESYPVARILAGAAGLTLAGMAWLRPRLRASLDGGSRLRERLVPLAGFLIMLAAAQSTVDITTGHFSDNRVANELAANGIYSFFSSARGSRLDYREYYLTVPQAEAQASVRRLVAQPNTRFTADAPNPLQRHIAYPGAARKLHVIVLLEESLGSEFIGALGDKRGLTPNLDRIAEESLLFTRMYATGTRTVRGMEAVTASFPPLPPESLVKRPHNENLFNWSTVMAQNGYSPTFLYGGFGAFDNMNHFFANNGYRVIDRTDMDTPKFANIWGVSDEDLFRNALRVFDEQAARGERIFSVIMTTSNHKPFTFPAGVPGAPPSGGGRGAGVRYADYAIGRFFDQLRTKPYANDTLVVIVADHGARIYGREDIPMKSYEIPFLVYAPGHVKPGRVDALASQLDVAPTVLGLLNISYDSMFFGRDILQTPDERRFAVLNHNRDVGLYSNGTLTEIGFRKTEAAFRYRREANQQQAAKIDPAQIRDVASLFQTADDLYRNGGYRWQ